MKLVEINSRYYNFPDHWNELSREQLLQVMAVFAREYPLEKALVKLVKILTGMSWWAFFRAPVTTRYKYKFSLKSFRLSIGLWMYGCKTECTGLEEVLYLTEFVINTNSLTKNLLPDYGGFHGPADEMNNLTMDEFVFSEHWYMQWAEDRNNAEALNNLVAVLYRHPRRFYNRRKNAKGDIRIAFNENLCAYYASKDIAGWPMAVKLAVAQYYTACREKWMTDNDDVFTGTGSEPARYGMISVMRGVAKSGVHGDMKSVGLKYVNEILMELNEMVIDAREYEKQLKR